MQIERGRKYRWYPETFGNDSILEKGDKNKGEFVVLEEESQEFLDKDINLLKSTGNYLFFGICYSCYGCRLDSIIAFREAIKQETHKELAIEGMIETMQANCSEIETKAGNPYMWYARIAQLNELKKLSFQSANELIK